MAQRILRGAAATLSYIRLDANGEAITAAGTMTVGVTNAAGGVVLAAGTATVAVTAGGVTSYTVALTGAQTVALDLYTATWIDSASPLVAMTTLHEIVGGFIASVVEVRAFEVLGNVTTYPSADVIRVRSQVEDEAEWICDRAFVPRFRRVTVDSVGEQFIDTGINDISRVRAVRMYLAAGSSSYTDLTAAQLAGLVFDQGGRIKRTDYTFFVEGAGNIVVDLEYGLSSRPADMVHAALCRLRERLDRPTSAISDRSKTFTNVDGDRYELAGQDEFLTGNAFVDAVYQRYSLRRRDGKDRPAFGSYQLDPSYFGLYNGGRR